MLTVRVEADLAMVSVMASRAARYPASVLGCAVVVCPLLAPLPPDADCTCRRGALWERRSADNESGRVATAVGP